MSLPRPHPAGPVTDAAPVPPRAGSFASASPLSAASSGIADPATDGIRGAADDVLRLSIIMCCHNSSARLEPTLRHLAAQSGIPPSRWEVVLVDNASTDGTAECAQAIWRSLGAPAELRVIVEPQLGISHARTAGILSARYEIVSFIDDDNWVCGHWGATIIDLMARWPDISVIASTSEAAFDPGQAVPEWFPAFQHGYAVGPQEKETGRIAARMPRYRGAGLSVRRDALLALFGRGFSTVQTGRSGKSLSAGEDAELCYALAMSGYRFWYEASLNFKHYMSSNRLTEDYARRLFRGLGVTSAVEELYLDLAPRPEKSGMREKYRRIRMLRFANAIRRLIGLKLRVLLASPGSAARAHAEIEASFFAGRLAGMTKCREEKAALAANIARWAAPTMGRAK